MTPIIATSRRALPWLVAAIALALTACDDTTELAQAPGTEQGPCLSDGSCDPGLVCASSLCVRPPDTSGDDTASPGDTSGEDIATDIATDTAADTSAPDTSGDDTAAGDTAGDDTGRLDVDEDTTDAADMADTADTVDTVDTVDTGDDTDTEPPDLVDELPVVDIFHPSDGEMRPLAADVPLIGEAIDPQDGELTGAALVWRSDVDGELGTGKSITVPLQSAGQHVISLEATDSDGNVGVDSITITMNP